MVDNPRHPHLLKIFRYQLAGDGDIATDNDGVPLNPNVIYSGKCGYREQGKPKVPGEVIVSDYKLSLPKIGVNIMPGDVAEVSDYARTFRGQVVKSLVYNMGTTIWINEIRN